MKILGIETSCDDTGAAIVEARGDGSFDILANVIKQQDHTETGGVVPEIAARHHATSVLPAIDEALKEAGMKIGGIDALAVTRGPGLIACLLVGVETAKTIAMAKGMPIIGVNHMEAHIASTFVEHPHMEFPAVALLASGGHTMLVGINEPGDYYMIGTTRDDAAGEAFDKVAKMLGLSYPGGPELEKLAKKGDPYAHDFPKPMINSDDIDFSFAGLKTAIKYYIRDNSPLSDEGRADIAASFQESIAQVLVSKTLQAADRHEAKTVVLGGGVSANKMLVDRLHSVFQEVRPETEIMVPSPGLFTDNGAMIAIAAAPRALTGDYDDWRKITVNPKLRIAESESK
ncbi:MAG: tRNA (adenosine(37)-N6)-threonylcarbamoyltransferase complex transferase subunit TsaD [Candidatus Kerfeldbacteria bacterium]